MVGDKLELNFYKVKIFREIYSKSAQYDKSKLVLKY